MRQFGVFLLFGAGFGFLLSRVGATDFDAIAGMFLLSDLHLMGVIGVAIAVAAVGLHRWARRAAAGRPAPTIAPKPVKPGLIVGAALFGAGWGLTGTCPGTGLAQVGEGRWIALFTVAGMLAGTALYRVVGARVEAALARRGARAADDRSAAPGEVRSALRPVRSRG
ncbi:MAG: hypothetical protein D6689_07625 [Deltaproteobacteria bacterium]|nr:MAG: hypothetical protein D6689_07625 [Deltaproteobacteria bacterium]